jgi:hypothetical protein
MPRSIPRRLILALALTAAAGPLPAHAAFNAGAAHLQIPPGARAEGMGRFFNAVADDAFAPWWNPGGMAFLSGWNTGLMHTRLVEGLVDDVYFEYLGVAKNIEGFGGVGGTFTYLSYGESQSTDSNSSLLDTFNPFEMSFSGAIGTPITSSLGVGMNLKFVLVDLTAGLVGEATNSGRGSTFGVDLGGLYKWDREVQSFLGSGPGQMSTRLGVTVANLGPNISLGNSKESDPLPRNLKVGASWGWRVPNSYSLLAGAAVEKNLIFSDIAPPCSEVAVDSTGKPTEPCLDEQLSFWERNEVLLSGGMEVGVVDLLFGRVGYLYDDVGAITDWTFGVGFRIKQFGLDFASIPQAEGLDRVSKFSVVARFD